MNYFETVERVLKLVRVQNSLFCRLFRNFLGLNT